MPTNLLVVESPSKAKTLKKYLGRNFEVLASYGHVRDLEAKEGAVDPEHGFRMKYALVEKNRKHVDAIARAAEGADQILLATDPDREGEAIAWHLSEILRGKKNLRNRPLKRVVFYEITESAVKEGVEQPRDISMPLVNAQQARRALDHLVGFNLSPLLWRKIGPSLSAGRVQSPALRLIVEREQEIEAFRSQEYWTIHLDSHKHKENFSARLTQYRGNKIEQFSVVSAQQQQEIVDALTRSAHGTATVVKVEKKPKTRSPAAPFITSTLQQEAVRKLGMSADRAMRTAQQLYEGVDTDGGGPGVSGGLITYMRTDSTNLSSEAVTEIRDYVAKNFSTAYLPKVPVEYRSKSKNAQEAHEAIRPTSIFRTPEQVREYLSPDQARLYEMIWKRTVACQMTAARYDTTAVDIGVGDQDALFRATGQTLVFPGYIAVYQEGADDAIEEGEEKLPALEEGEQIPADRIYGEQHFTLPPPRYTEASLVKKLEEYGIGRPSTYASIISTLQDRGYAVLDKKRFVPTDLGRLVNGFLTANFSRYVDYAFTAEMEEELDQISNGELDWVKVLREFWEPFVGTLQEKLETGRGVPLPAAEPRVSTWKEYAQRLLSEDWQQGGRTPESCPKCGKQLYLQNSKRGPFVGCSGYPKCDYTRAWGELSEGPVTLGQDPDTGLDVLLLKGPYGYYAQLGPTVEGAKTKPRRASWPSNVPVLTADLETALKVLSLPRDLGLHPETNKPVEANVGRFGPYVKHDNVFKSIPKSESVYDITLARAVELLAQPKSGQGGGRHLGLHPIDNKPVAVLDGRYGPYVKHGNVNVTVPSDMDPATLTLDDAVDLLAEKAAKELAKTGSTAAPL
ncbi:MAG TPA: type I DNA topoisomerase, partial [Burkholderiales bacterium]|nr:type I DNA topoisomerase [Burkholderiales bacterium]